MNQHILNAVPSALWLETCSPGPSGATRFRLFPSALFLLWVEALAEPAASCGAEPVAAALECLHNASLIHDDILDGHETRRGQPTLLARHGASAALLAGDGLCAVAIKLLAQLDDPRLPGCLDRLGAAFETLVAGQILDEPESWDAVSVDEQVTHWYAVSSAKLALGNVTAPLAAFWTGCTRLEEDLMLLMRSFSIISQIINDLGDTHGWSGFHILSRCNRPTGQEAARKPLFGSLAWNPKAAAVESRLGPLARARNEIHQRRELALERLQRLTLHPDRREIVLDFFIRPTLPEEITGDVRY